MPRVLIGPAPFKEIESVYSPTLRDAGLELVFPARHAQMTEAELLDQLPGCVASLAGSEPYTRKVIAAAAEKGLKVIARGGVGYDGVDLAAATDHGVVVTYAPGTNHEAVAEHTFLLMLALTRNFLAQHNGLREGVWRRNVVQPVRGRTLGVVGLGRIGKAVTRRAKAFDMNVVAAEIAPDHAFIAEHGVTLLPVDEVFRQADVLTLHVPQTTLTKHLVCSRTLDLMKPSAYLVNTSRGGVVNETDLHAALKAKRIAGAGLDVFDEEPPGANPLFALDNVVATAHTAGVDMKSRDDMALYAARAIVQLLAGGWPAEWVVNPQVRRT
jgi:D-3-phosphoglycerate dehydrogenase